MSLLLEEFARNCIEIERISSKFPGCEWKCHNGQDNDRLQFIAHSTIRILDNDPVVFQYHVMYSESYNVPVLYFNAWSRDGKLLRLEDVWTKISKMDEQHSVGLDPWTVLTQQEHPYLHQPWFMIHPCKTEEMMKVFKMDSNARLKNYVLTWLSAVANLVGLELPLEFAKEGT